MVNEEFSEDHYPGFEYADVSAAVSTDGGTTFGPLQSVPLADPSFTLHQFTPAVAVGSARSMLGSKVANEKRGMGNGGMRLFPFPVPLY